MLVVPSTRTNRYSPLYGMSKVEKGARDTKQRARLTWYQLATPAGEKMARQVIGE